MGRDRLEPEGWHGFGAREGFYFRRFGERCQGKLLTGV